MASAAYVAIEALPEPERSRAYLDGDPRDWVTFPVVPVKNPRMRGQYGLPATGIVTAISTVEAAAHGTAIRVYDANLFMLPGAKTLGELQEKLDAGDVHAEYATLDELVADGWVVD